MSTLVIQLPSRQRLSSRSPAATESEGSGLATEYEFVTTPEAMKAAAEKFLRIPARTDIPQADLPKWIQDANAKIKPMPVDRKVMADHLNEWMKYWDANIRNSGRKK